MAREELKVIKEAEIKNNCPECFNQELKLSFFQKHLYGRLYHRTTPQIQHQIECNKCHSVIYPVNWTDDIERSFDYYQKTVTPENAGTSFTPLFYGLIFGIIGMAILVYYLISEGIISV